MTWLWLCTYLLLAVFIFVSMFEVNKKYNNIITSEVIVWSKNNLRFDSEEVLSLMKFQCYRDKIELFP